MQRHRYLVLLLVLAFATLSSACSTVIKPTRPSEPLQQVAQVDRFRFDGEYVQLREPRMPLANSRAWQREVQNYTATTLNELLDTPDTARPVQTIVVFDLPSPGAFHIGTWKEMTIELTTTLPDGRVVRSEPVTENIDNWLEYSLSTFFGVAGPVLDVVSSVGLIALFIFSPPDPVSYCGCLLGLLGVGLAMNVAQSITAYFVAGSEERRWSDLYQRALTQHARDIEAALAGGPSLPPPKRRAAPREHTPGTPPPPPAEAPDEAPPPPPLLDPVDEAPSGDAGGAPGGTAF